MKRALLTIFTIAVLGGLGLYVQKKPGNSLSSGAGTTTAIKSPSPTGSGAANSSPTKYRDGTYTSANEDTAYGPVQIAVVISGGKITDVNFLQMPSDQGHSREVTAFAEPLLKQTTLQAQSANIEFVSGATSTSEGYQLSLQDALNQAAMS